MANQTISGGIQSNNYQWHFNEHEWVTETKKKLTIDVTNRADRRSAIICGVPRPMRDGKEEFFIPRIVSIGPYHFWRPELRSAEKHKDEAMRRMRERIQKFSGEFLNTIIELQICNMAERIRKCYSEEIPYSDAVLAWMVTRDACFIFECALNWIRHHPPHQKFMEDFVIVGMHDELFDGCIQNPAWYPIASDLLLLENQLPLFILEHLVEVLRGSQDAAKKQLKEMMKKLFEVRFHRMFKWEMRVGSKEPCHLLELAYLQAVGEKPESYKQKAISSENPQPSLSSIFSGFIFRSNEDQSYAKQWPAAELRKAGLRFRSSHRDPLKQECSVPPIASTRFDKKISTLYLPQIIVGSFSNSLWRNFVAMEVTCGDYSPRPICQFVNFMHSIVKNKEDVAVLMESDIIGNFLGSNEQLANFFIAVGDSVFRVEGCRPTDDAIQALRMYQGRRYKILWRQFLSAYFSKPWLVAGSVGATVIFFLTAVQIFCLFYSCNPRA